MSDAPSHLYRYVDEEDADEGGVRSRSVLLMRYPVVRATARGVWINAFRRKEKFVLLSGDRRFAYPESELDLARKSYRRRKQMQKWHAECTAARAAFGASLKDEDFPKPSGPEFRLDYDALVEIGAA